jgi:hypothetical protein
VRESTHQKILAETEGIETLYNNIVVALHSAILRQLDCRPWEGKRGAIKRSKVREVEVW